MMRRLILILSVLLCLGLPAGALAQEPEEGIISGQVINGTEGGGSVAGVEVTLVTYIDDSMADTRTTTTDDEGKFQFDGVNTEYAYLVMAIYLEVGYYYQAVFEAGETEAYVEVGVCDTTDSDEAIRAGLSHTIISVEEADLEVTQVFWLVNDSDRTYVGTDGALVFTLPEGAVSFEASAEMLADYRLLDDNRVAYLVPFPPGERQLFYSYRLAKPDSNEFVIPLTFDYPTDSFELMVGGEDIEVTASQLAPAEPVFTTTDERFIHFQGGDLPRGTVIDVRLASLSGDGGVFFTVLWVVIGAVIIGAAVYLLKKAGRKTSE